MKKMIKLFIVCVFCSVNLSAQQQFYVSPEGDDTNSGTEDQPLATLTAARNAIREYKKEHVQAVSFVVHVADGMYWMNKAFKLSAEDSGTPENPIVYKAEKGASPIFSGGKIIQGIKVNDQGIWEAEIPECNYYKWRFDQLYVNGKRAQLARTPNKGFLKIANVKQHVWERGTGRAAERAQQVFSFDADNFHSLKNMTDDELELIRFRAYHKWDFTIRHFDKIDRDSMIVFTSGEGMKPWNSIKKGGRIVFENYAAALDDAGEWFLNQEGTLSYIPLPGQTPENTEMIAPVLENLVSIKGNLADSQLVEYVQFEGLSFRHSHYRMPQTGFEPNQAAIHINSAIMLEGAKNISFSKCEVSHTGQHAVWFRKGCSHSEMRHCHLHNLGGGGVYLGDVAALIGAEHTHHIQLENNIIQSGGREFPPAVGVWVGHSSDNEIVHNDIGDFYYTGVSVGWVWGYKPSLSKRNTIRYNHIHHIGWDLLSDMAAVYTLGKSEGTQVSNNVIHHIHAYSYGGWGLYPDEGTSDIVMENNLVYSTKTGGFHQHYGKNNIIRNNILAFAKLYQAQCTRVEEHRSFNFTNNILIFDQGVVLKGAWNKIDIEMDNNLYWNTAGADYDFNGTSFEKWQQSGHDTNSLIANPNFKDAAKYDFRLKNRKNTKRINFKPFDYSKAGVYGSDKWKQKAHLSESIIADFNRAVEENMKTD